MKSIIVLIFLLSFIGSTTTRRDDGEDVMCVFDVKFECTLGERWCYELHVWDNRFFGGGRVLCVPTACTDSKFGGMRLQARFEQSIFAGEYIEPRIQINHNCTKRDHPLKYAFDTDKWLNRYSVLNYMNITPFDITERGDRPNRRSYRLFTKYIRRRDRIGLERLQKDLHLSEPEVSTTTKPTNGEPGNRTELETTTLPADNKPWNSTNPEDQAAESNVTTMEPTSTSQEPTTTTDDRSGNSTDLETTTEWEFVLQTEPSHSTNSENSAAESNVTTMEPVSASQEPTTTAESSTEPIPLTTEALETVSNSSEPAVQPESGNSTALETTTEWAFVRSTEPSESTNPEDQAAESAVSTMEPVSATPEPSTTQQQH